MAAAPSVIHHDDEWRTHRFLPHKIDKTLGLELSGSYRTQRCGHRPPQNVLMFRRILAKSPSTWFNHGNDGIHSHRRCLRRRGELSIVTAVKAWPSPYIIENDVFRSRVARDCSAFQRMSCRCHLPGAGSCSPGLCHHPFALERCQPYVFLLRRKHYL